MADQWLHALLLLFAFWNNVHAQSPFDTEQYPFDWYKGDVKMFCPNNSDWLQLGSRCYLPVINKEMRWDEAAMNCRRPENSYGQLSTLDNWILTRYLAAHMANNGPFWLGLSVSGVNSTTLNTSQIGQTKSIFNALWAEYQPNLRPDRYCVMSNLNWENETLFGWAIDVCNSSRPFICETIACYDGEWRCNDSSKCIDQKAQCDHVQDCDDNSDELNCGIKCVDGLRTSTSGEIFSPGFPNNYPSNSNCEWRLQLGQGSRIALQFNVFDLEPLHDMLIIQDGEATTLADEQRFSDTKSGEKWISKSNIVTLKFVSDDNLERQGFHISYTLDTSIQNCDRTFEDSSGNFSPPGYYGSDVVTYAPDQRCNWVIRNPDPNGIVSIQFSRFEIAEGDVLRLYDGLAANNMTIGDFSSDAHPPTSVSSSSPIMNVYFRSAENSRGAVGFVIHYQQSCVGQKISVESGSIESPGARTGIAPPFPFSCSWDLESPQSTDGVTQEFTLYFDSLNLKDQDRIIVSSSNSVLKSISVGTTTQRIRSENGILAVSFKISPGRTQWGSFTASFSIDCPMLTGLSSLLKDPVYSHGNEYLSVVQFGCREGYVIQGVSSITCLSGGKWSAEIPNCKRVYCLPVPTVDRGYLRSITGLQLGDRLMYDCEYGYRPLHTESTCSSSKKWEPAPTCQLIDCGTPKSYHEAIVMELSNGSRLNSRAFYKCSRMTAQTFGAPPFRFCQSDGTWSEANFHCRETACFAYPLPYGRFDQISESIFGQTSIIADRGFQAYPSSVVCNENLTWSETPTIEDINECLTPNRCKNGVCENLIGTYTCACRKGYVEQWTSPESMHETTISDESSSSTISLSATTETTHSITTTYTATNAANTTFTDTTYSSNLTTASLPTQSTNTATAAANTTLTDTTYSTNATTTTISTSTAEITPMMTSSGTQTTTTPNITRAAPTTTPPTTTTTPMTTTTTTTPITMRTTPTTTTSTSTTETTPTTTTSTPTTETTPMMTSAAQTTAIPNTTRTTPIIETTTPMMTSAATQTTITPTTTRTTPTTTTSTSTTETTPSTTTSIPTTETTPLMTSAAQTTAIPNTTRTTPMMTSAATQTTTTPNITRATSTAEITSTTTTSTSTSTTETTPMMTSAATQTTTTPNITRATSTAEITSTTTTSTSTSTTETTPMMTSAATQTTATPNITRITPTTETTTSITTTTTTTTTPTTTISTAQPVTTTMSLTTDTAPSTSAATIEPFTTLSTSDTMAPSPSLTSEPSTASEPSTYSISTARTASTIAQYTALITTPLEQKATSTNSNSPTTAQQTVQSSTAALETSAATNTMEVTASTSRVIGTTESATDTTSSTATPGETTAATSMKLGTTSTLASTAQSSTIEANLTTSPLPSSLFASTFHPTSTEPFTTGSVTNLSSTFPSSSVATVEQTSARETTVLHGTSAFSSTDSTDYSTTVTSISEFTSTLTSEVVTTADTSAATVAEISSTTQYSLTTTVTNITQSTAASETSGASQFHTTATTELITTSQSHTQTTQTPTTNSITTSLTPSSLCTKNPTSNAVQLGALADSTYLVKTCVDIDECAAGLTLCDYPGKCVNEDGGYRCGCPSDKWLFTPDRKSLIANTAYLAINQSCINQRCEVPPPSSDRMVRFPSNGLYLVDSTVIYYCTDGNVYESAYQPAAYTCRLGGQWSSGQIPQPNCSKIPCDDPRQGINNGRLTTDQATFFAGDVIEYTCDSNYLLVGPNRRVCFQYPFENRPRWVSPSAPRCIGISCPRITAPVDGTMFVSQSEFIVGSTAWFACKTDFDLIGSSVLSCQSDQTWSDTVPTCEAKKCVIHLPPSMEVAGSLDRKRNQFNMGEQISFRCLGEGYALNDSTPVKCLSVDSTVPPQLQMDQRTPKYSGTMQIEYRASVTISTPCESALQSKVARELRSALRTLPNCSDIDLVVDNADNSADKALHLTVALTGSRPAVSCMQQIKAHINDQMKQINPRDEPLCAGLTSVVTLLNITNDVVSSSSQTNSRFKRQDRRKQKCIEMISSNALVFEGATVHLWCVMSASCDQKLYNIMWTRGSNELALRQTDDNRIEVVQTNTRIVDIRITPVRLIDNGTYSCKVWDKARGDVVEKSVLKLEVIPNSKPNDPKRINPEILLPNTTVLYDSTTTALRNAWQAYTVNAEAGWIVLPDNSSALLRNCPSNDEKADSWIRSPFIRMPNGVFNQVIRVRLSYATQRCQNDACMERVRVLWWQTNEVLAAWTVDDFEEIFELPADETLVSFELPTPITKIGFYLAFQDTGSCTTILDLDVKSVACPAFAVDLTVFPTTPAPSAAEGSRYVDAGCVNGARTVPVASKLQCTVEGRWRNISGEGVQTVCICKPGYVLLHNTCKKQGPLCYECSNASSVFECASTPDRVRHCAVDNVCRTTVSHLKNGQLVLDKGCAPASECTVSITNWNDCLTGKEDCTLCCKDDYCNFPPNAANGKAAASPRFDRPIPTCRDVIPPTFYDCPENISVSIAMKNFTLPTVVPWPKFKDNQYNVSVSSMLADLTSDAYVFNQTVKEVKWTATDQAGLKSVCTVPVIYQDTIPPVLKCPSEAIIVNVSSSTSPETRISFPAVAVLDASTIQSITYSPANGSLVPIDRPIEVVAVAVDKFGNSGSCRFWYNAKVNDCPHWMINKDEYSCVPTPVGRSIMCVSNKACKNGRKMFPIDVDVISCSSNGDWHRLSRSNNQSFDNINDNPSLPMLPRCIDLGATPVSFEVILNISGHIEKTCLDPLINATKGKLEQRVRDQCGDQFEYAVVFQSVESQWKPGLSRPVYQVTILGTVETIVPESQVHLAKVCVSQFATSFSKSAPIFEPTECSTIQLIGQAGVLKADAVCEPGWVLADSTGQLPSLCQKCPAGTFADQTTEQCAPCPKGTYSSVDGEVECTECSLGRSTLHEYSRSPADCLSECGAGYYSATGLAPCNSCTVGYFQQNSNQTDCEPCPAGTTTASSATANVDDCKRPCVPGQYSDTGLEPCQPCPFHHFQPLSAQMYCIRCSFGMVTNRVGVRAPSDCLTSISCAEDYCRNNGTCTDAIPLPHCDCPLGFAGVDCSVPTDLCFSALCKNGGTCRFDQLQSICDCRPGFEGERCEKIALCSDNLCLNGGTCAAGQEHIECICPEPYSGQYCQDSINDDPCTGVICANGTCMPVEGGGIVCDCDQGFELQNGVCTLVGPCAFQPCVNATSSTGCTDSVDEPDSNATFHCICDPNWTGEFCERTVNNCSTTECNNNGTCVMVFEGGSLVPKCICPPRFTGSTCSESRVACDASATSLSCNGNGKCQNNGDHFICHCDIGYVGEFCSVRKSSCIDSPCLHGATCTDESEQPTCHCTHGWTGQNCSTPIDYCAPNNPCEHGGLCLPVFSGYYCHCIPSFTGTNCSIWIEPCCSQPCAHGAVCNNVGGGYGGNYTCDCLPGFTGHNCDTVIDSCASHPCSGNASCVHHDTGYSCICAPGYDYDNGQCIRRNPCIENLCENGGTCVPSGNTFYCNCTPNFDGSNCQHPIPCARNPCGPNGTCVQWQDSSQYNCTCDYGFSGKNCSENEQLCNPANNPCLNGGQCVDNAGGFLSCNCLANYTGNLCETPKKLNFNLNFTGLPGMKQIVSYDFRGILLKEFTLCSWVRYNSNSSASAFAPLASKTPFITMAVYRESITNDTPLLVIDGSSVSISGVYRLEWVIDQHQWHHICVRSPLASDKSYNWTLSVDGVIVRSKLLQELQNQADIKYQLLLGQSVDGSLRFSGQMGLVQLYYTYINDSKIAAMFFECNKWLNESDSSGLIINWNQFTTVDKYDNSVKELYPGICVQSSCFPGHRGCGIDKTPPEIVYCPSDQHVVSRARLAVVKWEQPRFRDNVQVTDVTSNYRSSQVFVWGEYRVIYIARDLAGNTAICAFSVVVAPSNCTTIADPVDGDVSFDKSGGILHARIKCKDDYGFSEVVRDFYTCDKMGRWNPRLTSELQYSFPACSKASTPLQQLDGNVTMKDADCSEMPGLEGKLHELINEANRKNNNFCGGPDCNQLIMIPSCKHKNDNFRRKRQAPSGGVHISYTLTVNATRKAVEPYVSDMLQHSIFGTNGTVGNIVTSWSCAYDFSEFMADSFNDVHQCVECPVGKFWNESSQICQNCALNTYQNKPNQTHCLKCPDNKITATTGSRSESDCFPKCPPGDKYSFALRDCVKCEKGTYQQQYGSITCIPCPDGMTTNNNGSTNATDCVFPCNPGQQLTVDDYCKDCELGTYKIWRNQTACVSCPIGFTTSEVGAKFKSECDVLNCPPGTHIVAGLHPPVNQDNGYTVYCPLCQYGFYQEVYNQTTCVPCNTGDTTPNLGSTSVRDCVPGWHDECSAELPDSCPANQTCEHTDQGYKCMGADNPESEPVKGNWQVWVGITGVLILLAILVAVVIVVFKIRVYQFLFCCKHPNLKDISTTQYYRNNTYPIGRASSADETVTTVNTKPIATDEIGASFDSMSAADVYKEIYAGLQSMQSDETLFDYLVGGTGSAPGTGSFDESPDDPGPSSPPPPILPPVRPSRERFEANSAGFYNPSFDSGGGAQSPTWEQSDAFEGHSVSSSWAKIEQLNKRGANDPVLFASGSITMRSNGFQRQTAMRTFEPQPRPPSAQPPIVHSEDDDDDDYFG